MDEKAAEDSVFACCSAGIGRWMWVAWESEADAKDLAPALKTGFAKNAAEAEKKAIETLGPAAKRLPTKWASAFRKGGSSSARNRQEPSDDGEPTAPARPKSRLSRQIGSGRKGPAPARLAFLYSASESAQPGEVVVARHRIVRQNPRKILVEFEPFREEEWAAREEAGSEASKVRTVNVDRTTLRAEGRFRTGRTHRELTFYATEDDGIRDIEADLTARNPWCADLGVRFPCSKESIKAAYRRLARLSHPDVGGDPAQFRIIEQAYRAGLAFFGER